MINKLKYYIGVAFIVSAGIMFIMCFAACASAALWNRQGELGKGLDLTILAARLFMAALMSLTAGVPLWYFNKEGRKPLVYNNESLILV